jgi:hypothetical protein
LKGLAQLSVAILWVALFLGGRADAAEPRVKIWLTVDAKSERGLTRLLAGDRLKSGDQFQMRVRADRAAYLYVVQFFPDGTSQVLFPAEGEVSIAADEEMRLPPEGYWFKLDDTVGRENIYVIASERPITEADKATAALLSEVRRSGSKPKPKKPPQKKVPPDALAQAEPQVSGLTMKTRGVLLVKESADEPMQVQADRDCIAVVLFSFEHVRR